VAGFRSLRERLGGAPNPDEVLPLHVPPHMRQPTMHWLEGVCDRPYASMQSGRWALLCQMLKIDYTAKYPYDAIVEAVNQDNDVLLDLLDARLKLRGMFSEQLNDLGRRLLLAGSGWRINDTSDGLEQVVDDTVRATTLAALREGEQSASQHLANAWSETFGRDKNRTQAHAEMIRAVESAAVPIVTPNDRKATLGTVIGQLEAQGSLYSTAGASPANDGVAAVVSMMKLLWQQQQTDRHGANPTIPATQERVEFLLPVAAALVHAFSTGAVRRVR